MTTKPSRGDPLLFGGTDDPEPPPGMVLLRGALGLDEQASLVETISRAACDAPFVTPTMRDGTPFKVQVTTMGRAGWWSDRSGYRYVATHPETGRPWPKIPGWFAFLTTCVADSAGFPGFVPDSCLVNQYVGGATLGLHVDDTESDLTAPVVSVSLGDDCVFRFGGRSKSDPTQDWRLRSGDVVVFGGPSRLAWHAVTRTFPGTSSLVPGGGRLNLTLRRA